MTKKISIYYVEDTPKDYKELFYYLDQGKIDIFPKPDNYEAERAIIEGYFSTPKKATAIHVSELFKKYAPSLFIMDVKLFGDDDGGPFLYKNLIKKESDFAKVKVLYLSSFEVETKSSETERFCPKVPGDPKATAEHVLEMIKFMLKVNNISSISEILKDLFR